MIQRRESHGSLFLEQTFLHFFLPVSSSFVSTICLDLTLIFHLHRYDSFFVSRSSILMIFFPRKTVPPSFESHHTAGDTLTHDDTSIPMNSGQIHVIQTRSFFFFLFFFFFFKAYLITLSFSAD